MRRPIINLLVASAVGVTYLVMAGAFIFSWLDRSLDLQTGYGPEYAAVYLGGLAVPPIVGGLVAVKQPRNPYGWIWLVLGFALILRNCVQAYALHGLLVDRGPLPMTGLVIAALFAPLRKRVQDFTDRRFFRKKYNAQRMMDQFSRTARDEVSLEALTAELTRVVQETMQPEQVSTWLKKGGIASR